MRITMDVEDKLMEIAMLESGLRSKRAVVEAGLRELIRRQRRRKLRDSFGKYPWDGDLSEIRRSWERRG